MIRTFLLCVVALVAIASVAEAQVRVRSYVRSDGTYVSGHYRSSPDSSFYNNWSTYPNVNPYTGATGTRYSPNYYRSYQYQPYQYQSYGRYGRSGYGW
jgi:hypothetical protein